MKVLIGVDGSVGGFAAVRQAGRLMDPARDQAVLYYTPPEIRVGNAEPEVAERAGTALASAIFDEARNDLPDGLRESATTIVGEKNPRHGLLLAADAEHADWIALGAGRRANGKTADGKRLDRGRARRARACAGGKAGGIRARGCSPARALGVRRIDIEPRGGPVCLPAALAAGNNHDGCHGHRVAPGRRGSLVARGRARSADADAMAQAWVREHETEKQQKQEELSQYCQGLPECFRSAKTIVAEGHPAEQILHVLATERGIW